MDNQAERKGNSLPKAETSSEAKSERLWAILENRAAPVLGELSAQSIATRIN